MSDMLKFLRSTLIIGFIFYLIFLFAKFLLIPFFIFIIIMKLLGGLSSVKFNYNVNNAKKKQSKKDVIDGEFEEVD